MATRKGSVTGDYKWAISDARFAGRSIVFEYWKRSWDMVRPWVFCSHCCTWCDPTNPNKPAFNIQRLSSSY